MKGELFNSVKLKKVKKNAFDLSHQVLTTGNMGELIPILCQEVVPGDVFRCRSEIFCRLMPMLAPVMQRVDIYTHYFFVPNRLLWNINEQRDSWKAFITGGKDGDLEPIPPCFDLSDILLYIHGGAESAPDSPDSVACLKNLSYFGLPNKYLRSYDDFDVVSQNIDSTYISAMPFIAYQLIYDEYYRDQNFTDPIIEDSSGIPGGVYDYDYYYKLLPVRKRSWKKDYFTSALPWAQRGEPVTFSLAGDASVSFGSNAFLNGFIKAEGSSAGDIIGVYPGSNESFRDLLCANKPTIDNQGLDSVNFNANVQGDQGGYVTYQRAGEVSIGGDARDNTFTYLIEDSDGINVDLSNVSALNVQMLREGLRLQEWLERNAVGGARYVEQIYAHFGEMVPDATIQRPLYLGGGKQTIRISEVLQSVETDTGALGEMAGHGISVGRTNGFNSRKFTEHGYIIGIMSVIPKASYMQGINRSWTRMNKLDYYFPEFAHLGEQEVKVSELVWRGEHIPLGAGRPYPNLDNSTFGYQSRYAEYKYNEDRISGEFRNSLDYWHLGRKFDRQFTLNQEFLEVQIEETERIFAVQDNGATDKLLFQIYHDMQAIRPMPKFATPYI